MTRSECLHLLGIQPWVRKSPVQISSGIHLIFDRYQNRPCCLALLPMTAETGFELSAAGKKIYDGMLNVLQLTSSQIICAELKMELQPTPQEIQQINVLLQQFSPQHILCFNKPISCGIDNTYRSTYHPEHLVHNTSDKRATYTDLLGLKEKL